MIIFLIPDISDSIIQLICVAKATGLGLLIKGGANRADGPMVFIQDLMPGGDCQKDGRLQVGDQLVSINKESLIGVTHEEARSILARTKLRPDPTVEIAFIRRSLWSGSSRGSPNLQAPAGAVTKAPGSHSRSPAARRGDQSTSASGQSRAELRLSTRGRHCHSEQLCPEAAAVEPHQSQRLKLNHLEQALDRCGLKPSEAQQQVLRSRLRADPAGTVSFTDFQMLIHEMFESPSDEPEVAGSRSRLFGLLDSPGNHQTSLSDSEDLEEMEQLRKEHIEALREMKRLQEQLVESQQAHHQMEEELNKVRQELELLRTEESQALTTQIQLAEEAQKQARGMEMDYEEVIHLLEAEIAELKSQRMEPSLLTSKDKDELKKKIAILECQLRKSETARKRFETAAGKLLSFVENVQEFLLENHGPPKSSGDLKVGASSLTAQHKKSPWTSASLIQEAKELSRTVRSMMEVDCLPYGSEEAYTADGVKYYINHVTQTTSWS
uniref:Syntaxin binding protein 4 n=1 Tax=Tetraodon nigroviridis TaxID=99883 RepID=H3CD41_TETNG